VEVRVFVWSLDKFQISQSNIFTITIFLGLCGLWNFQGSKGTYRGNSGRNFRIIFAKLDTWNVVQIISWEEA
jgi:hypothetical protein